MANANKFSAQFLADLKKSDPTLYTAYTSGKSKRSISPRVALNLTPDGKAMWTITVNEGSEGLKFYSFPSTENKDAASSPKDSSVVDQFGKTWKPWFNKNGQLANNGLISSENGFNQEVNDFQIRINDAGSSSMPFVADPYITTLKQVQLLQSTVLDSEKGYGDRTLTTKEFQMILDYGSDNHVPNPKDPNRYLGVVPTYTVNANTGKITRVGGLATFNGQIFSDPNNNTTYQYTAPSADSGEWDKHGNYTGPKKSTPTTVPKPPTPTTVPKPTPTTVPKPTPTTVPKPPTPTTVPKPPTPTTVPKPPTPTTVPKTSGSGSKPKPSGGFEAPKVTTTVPPNNPKPTATTVPKTTTTVPKPATTAPKATTTTVPANGDGSFNSSNTFGVVRYPSYDWFGENYKLPKNLSKDETQKWVNAFASIADPNLGNEPGQLIPTGGIQSPSPSQYLTFMANDLVSRAAAQGIAEPNKFRDAVMDTMFGIKNWNWRDIVAGDASSKTYQIAEKRLNKNIWPNVVSQGLQNYKRDAFTFTEAGSDAATQVQAILDGINVITNANATATNKSNAANYIDNQLDSWGLGSLKPHFNDLVWKSGVTSGPDLMKLIRNTPEYKQRFKGMTDHNANPNFPKKLSEGEFLSSEKAMMDLARQYLPPNFFSLQRASDLIGKGVDVEEFKNRVMKGYAAAMSADATTRKYLAAQGVDLQHLAAYFLDPKVAEPILTQNVAKATLRGYAENVGLQDFTKDMADQLADQVRRSSTNPYGTFTMDQARKAIEYAGMNQGLSGAAPGAATPTVDTNQLIGSQIPGFGGTNEAEANIEVMKAQQAQAAPFNKGGGYEITNRGVTGTGSAPQ